MKTKNTSRLRGAVIVVNRHKTGMKQHDFYVGRPSLLGNPFRSRNRESNIRLYREWLHRAYSSKLDVRNVIDDMAALVVSGETVRLSCWCTPEPCHADVIRHFVISVAKKSVGRH